MDYLVGVAAFCEEYLVVVVHLLGSLPTVLAQRRSAASPLLLLLHTRSLLYSFNYFEGLSEAVRVLLLPLGRYISGHAGSVYYSVLLTHLHSFHLLEIPSSFLRSLLLPLPL